MSSLRTVAAGCVLALLATPLMAGAAQAHCGHNVKHVRMSRLYGAPRHDLVRTSFVERGPVYGGPVYRGTFVQPVALRRDVIVEQYRPEIGAGQAIVIARHHGLAELKSAEHRGGHWNVDGWTWDGRWIEAQVYGDGRLKRVNIDG